MNLGKQFKDGMLTQNPVLVQVLGMCSTMAITTSFFNGIGMGVAVTIILTLSNIIISAMRKIIPDKIRIAMFIVVIAGFVTCVDLSIQAFLPDLANSLGVFIPLIVVNCIILGRAEAFSYKNGMVASFFDGIFQGIGYTWVLLAMCIIREFLGGGTFGGGVLGAVNEAGQHVGIQIFPADYGIGMLTLPVGGFLVLAALIAAMQWALARPKKDKEESKYWKSLSCFRSRWAQSWQTTSSSPSSWAAAPSWAFPRRWIPQWAWAWPLPSLWVWPPLCALW